jgi:hypothetical protein
VLGAFFKDFSSVGVLGFLFPAPVEGGDILNFFYLQILFLSFKWFCS